MNAQTESVPAAAPVRFVKIGADGKPLPRDAADWVAVADSRSGLMWAREPVAVKNWKAATEKKIAAQFGESRLGGFDDWRIPTVEELFPLADRTGSSPAIDTEFFPGCPSDWFWTSTPYAPVSGVAWGVNFYSGGSGGGYRSYRGFVRAVRGGQ